MLESGRARRSAVAVQSAHALEKEVYRAKLGDEPIKIKVEGLLDYLCCNHDAPLSPDSFGAEAFNGIQLFFPSMLIAIAGMK
jgi:hypothetical protein